MSKARAAALVACIALFGVACGASSGNGEAGKSASQILTDATNCLRSATSVEFKGSGSTSGMSAQFDEHITSNNSGSGVVTASGIQIQFIAVDGQFFINADAEIWTALGASASEVPLLANNWVTAPPQLQSQFGAVIGFSKLADYLSNPGPSLSNAGVVATPDGRQGIKLAAGKDAIYVSPSGPACPIYLHVGVESSSPADIALSNFNLPVVVTPPPNPVDGTSALGG